MIVPYWLCEKRRAQESRPVMRFDPRFWTLNFPRPMMASVVTTGPESLRVDTVFYRSDDLAGLIWESEDRWDHPLLAYETKRDYRRLTLSFHWRSQGLLPLDAINGPTLTIEGRDAAGQPKSWYVRLWNYASGTPDNAQIRLPFNMLEGGFLLPDEADPVFAGDIDRMFISLVPPGYSPLGADLPASVEGWVELSDIRCDGAGVMLDTGDALLPEHALKMATGYDDAYNQTPERLLRQIEALGYRGTINHYVGMSHYFRLDAVSGEHYVSLADGALNTPCRAWHLDFANRAKARGYDLIFSLSYELFDAHCWNDWN
ncbi:MAG: non-contractile tail sheath protein, partial [Sphingorhabdus sp.]